MLFEVLYKILTKHDRETIYLGRKGNVDHTEHGYLDDKYWAIKNFSQGSTQNLERYLFPKHLIGQGIVQKYTNDNLTDISGDLYSLLKRTCKG